MPGGRIVDSEGLYEKDPLARPYVLKPVNEGSSVGVAIVTDESNYGNPIRRDVAGPWQEFAQLLAEPYIRGRELTCAVLDEAGGPRALAVTELVPKSGFYDFDAKYTEGMTEHVCPAELPERIEELCKGYAVQAHKLLGCRGCSRTDFRWDDEQGDATGDDSAFAGARAGEILRDELRGPGRGAGGRGAQPGGEVWLKRSTARARACAAPPPRAAVRIPRARPRPRPPARSAG